MGDDADLTSWVALHGLPGMGPVTFRRLLDRFGSPARVLREADTESLAEIPGLKRDLAEAVFRAGEGLERARTATDRLRARGVRIVRMTDPAYPPRLHDLPNPPPLLYMVGEAGPRDARAVGMVGTTKPSKKGRAIAEAFAAHLAGRGVTVVSGYAHGCDAAAHRGAFRGGGRSLLVLPFGIRRFKPRADFPPVAEIARRGAILTECPPERAWSASAAVARNRLIAALAQAVVVIETRPRGGTMHTVKAAERLRRPLFVLKYQNPPDAARGNAILLAKGAAGIAKLNEVDRVVEALG
jgi:DNA processing protein